MSSFSIVLPCLNEEESLKTLIPELLRKDCEIIVCDNGSTDGSVVFIRGLCVTNPNLKISSGRGTVVDAILRGVVNSTCDKIVVMDSDGSHPVAAIDKMVESLKSNDIVVGSRYRYGAGSKDTLVNRVLSRGFNILSYPLVPFISDRSSGFWAARREVFYPSIRNTLKPMLEFIVRGKVTRIGEVPYLFNPRVTGHSKLGRSFKTLLKEFYGLALLYGVRFQRPIKFLTVGGLGIGINLGLLAFFTEVVGLWYVLSSFLAIITTTIFSYLANNYWTFKNKDLL